ncbi:MULTISPECIES: hypothetical protein [unclassified Geodermatophilus]
MRTASRVLGAGALCAAVLVLIATDLVVRARHPAAFPVDGGLGLPVAAALALATLAFTVVGVLLVCRVAGTAYGWAPAGLGLGIALLQAGFAVGQIGALPRWVELPLVSSAVPVVLVSATAVFALFPDGRLPGPRWRWLPPTTAGAAGVAVALGLLLGPDPSIPGLLTPGDDVADAAGTLSSWLVLVLTGCLLAAAAAPFVRHRSAGPTERQQLRWFAAAGLAFGGTALVASLGSAAVPQDDTGLVVGVAVGVSLVLPPAAIWVAVSRYRLYDLDRLASRTVSYALLTGLLLALYLGLVTGLRPLLTPLTGTSELAVAASTLAVAAAFSPLRRRLQGVVDRRFDRSRYDAARAVDAYARRLRTSVDLDAVTGGLRDTVAATVGPDRVGIWLRETTPPREAGA